MAGPIVRYSSAFPEQINLQENTSAALSLTVPAPDKSEIEDKRRLRTTSFLEVALPKCKMMDDHMSYHQSITSQEAERRLKMFGVDSYLTRYSRSRKCYVLTVYRKQYPEDVIEHFEIVIEETGQHKIKGKKDESFDNIGYLLSHYEVHRISPSFPKIGRYYTEEEFNNNQAEFDRKKEQSDKQKEDERKQETSRKCIIL